LIQIMIRVPIHFRVLEPRDHCNFTFLR